MTADELTKRFLNEHTEDEILERVQDLKMEFLNPEDVENDFDGDIDDAYEETGRGAAESQVLQEVLQPIRDNCDTDTYLDVWDKLCTEWNISTN